MFLKYENIYKERKLIRLVKELVNMKGDNVLVLVFGAVFLLSMILLVGNGLRTTGYVTEDTTISNVTIDVYFSFAMSGNLTEGIQFGSVSALPATNVNASHNYDGENTTEDSEGYNFGTAYYLNVSTDSNTAVDFCLMADALNTSGGDEIGLENETYYYNNETNSSLPDLASEVSINETYVKASQGIIAGEVSYYRFWLDVPASTPTGVYNNTVSFKAVSIGGAC